MQENVSKKIHIVLSKLKKNDTFVKIHEIMLIFITVNMLENID